MISKNSQSSIISYLLFPFLASGTSLYHTQFNLTWVYYLPPVLKNYYSTSIKIWLMFQHSVNIIFLFPWSFYWHNYCGTFSIPWQLDILDFRLMNMARIRFTPWHKLNSLRNHHCIVCSLWILFTIAAVCISQSELWAPGCAAATPVSSSDQVSQKLSQEENVSVSDL